MTPTGSVRTAAMTAGRQADSERRRQRVLEALQQARQRGEEITASALARQARVDRTFLYRHRDLLEAVHAAQQAPATTSGTGPRVSPASLRADLINAQDRAARLNRRVNQLEKKLSEALGQQVWRAADEEAHDDVGTLQRHVAALQQECADIHLRLDERDEELQVARTTNRELMAQLNRASGSSTPPSAG
ncbi:DUF6262 family protein [Streptomyces sp. NPDC093510]|uniref:DUF6262 family protein n=1 Tax=Streptomyces sp. NPDC093510 TaxID=3155199 RepID=UPI003447503A